MSNSTYVWTLSDANKLLALVKQIILAQRYILIFVIIFTILGNTLVLVATWREKKLHQPNKYFVACLAVADLLVGMLVAPIQLYRNYKFFDSNRPPPSIHLCRFMAWIDTATLTASIYTLTFISIDRYVKISKPLQYKSRITSSTSVKIIFSLWLISCAFATYAATPNSGSDGILQTAYSSCNKPHINFYIFLSIVVLFLPIVVMIGMYVLIYLLIRKRRKMLQSGELGQMVNDQNRRATFFQDLKVIRLFLIVIGVFVFCWLPYFSQLFYKIDNPNFYHIDIYSPPNFSRLEWISSINLVVYLLPLMNSLCNPIIYACLDQTYKKAFRNIFKRIICLKKREQPNAIELATSCKSAVTQSSIMQGHTTDTTA